MIRFDLRLIFGMIFFFALFYWLLIMPSTKENSDENLGHLQNQHIYYKQSSYDNLDSAIQNENEVDNVKEFQKLQKKYNELNSHHSKETDNLNNENSLLKAAMQKSRKEILELSEQIERLKDSIKQKDIHFDATLELDKRIYEISEQNDKLRKVNLMKNKDEELIKPFDGLKLVHFDLKGAPPKIDYLIRMMKFSKELGANGFLIEYEDMFPYSNDLAYLARPNCYSKTDIELIVKTAQKEKLIIIPLVQTFGHLEFALKHEKLQHLRENKLIANSVCPLNNDTYVFLKNMIYQIHSAHPHSKWIHLGGDEVWNIKTCDRCIKSPLSTDELFTDHMMKLFKYTKSFKTLNNEMVEPVIWDDMLRNWSVEKLKIIAEHVSPMVWAYEAELKDYRKFPEDMWEKYIKSFPFIWIASSFKGALKAWSDFVPIKQHLENHLSWLRITSKMQSTSMKILGIALTGWSRYDHYGPLCELLPAGIPSLALSLAVLNNGKFDVELHKTVSKKLGFNETFKIKIDRFNTYKPEIASYDGGDCYYLVGLLENSLGWKALAEAREIGWTRPFQSRLKHVSYFHLNFTRNALNISKNSILEVQSKAREVLNKYFDLETVNEWLVDKVEYQIKRIDSSIKKVSRILDSF
ncbi:hexosaminidase D isoform X1 [Hydra vulgaris]|uniref:hexosaminidase D isoform X1 n=2 Tax=Hydra vulgaris TaxID=6087 RepID=UPI0001925777|nr:hexosaminidase D-like isoform X1 [Hydra vulgaris]